MVQYIKNKNREIEKNPEDIPFSSVYIKDKNGKVVENKQYANKDVYIKTKEGKIIRG
jgi:hypothetical protein